MEQVLIMQKASKNMVLIRIKHIRGLIIGLVRVYIFLKILILQNGGHVIYQVRNIIRGAIRSYIEQFFQRLIYKCFGKKMEQFHQQLFQTGKAYLLNEGSPPAWLNS